MERVGSIAMERAQVVRDDVALETAEALLAEVDAAALAVTGEDGRLRGFVSAGEIVRARSEERDSVPPPASTVERGVRVEAAPALVGDIPIPPAASIPVDASIDDAVARLLTRGGDRLAVTSPEGSVLGVVTARALLEHVARSTASPPASVPPPREAGEVSAALARAVLRAFALDPSLAGASVRALDAVREHFGLRRTVLWVLDGTRPALLPLATSSASPERERTLGLVSVEMGEGVAGDAWASGRLVEQYGPSRTSVGAPLAIDAEVVGVLELEREDGAPLSLAERDAIEALAHELAELLAARRRNEPLEPPEPELAGPPSIAFFDLAGRLTYQSGPPLLDGAGEGPVARAVDRAARGQAFTEVASRPGGARCLAFSPMRQRSGAIAGVVAVGLDTPRPILAPSAERLRSLGAGAAHELNDALTALKLSTDRWMRQTPPAMLPPGVASAIHRVERVAATLGAVARGVDHATVLDVREVLDGTLALFSSRFGPKVEVRREHGDLPLVRVPVALLGAALVDVLGALADALPPNERPALGRVLRARTRTEGGHLEILLEHQVGGASEIDHAAFGRGVDAARSLVRRLGGELVAQGGPGRAGVELRLAAHPPTRASEPPRDGRSGAVVRRVLVIDDDEGVADVIARELGHLEVTVAHGGRRALQLLFRPHAFDVIVCDLMMPEVTGMDVFELVRLHDPDGARRFVFVTGAAFTSRASTFLEEVTNPRLLKPFTGAALRSVVEARGQKLGPRDPQAVGTVA